MRIRNQNLTGIEKEFYSEVLKTQDTKYFNRLLKRIRNLKIKSYMFFDNDSRYARLTNDFREVQYNMLKHKDKYQHYVDHHCNIIYVVNLIKFIKRFRFLYRVNDKIKILYQDNSESQFYSKTISTIIKKYNAYWE